MNIALNHQNLNVFTHFGDSAENENNTTRAFLIAATRSPWSPMLLRGFFDLVASWVKENAPDQVALFGCFSQAWPDEIEISMERNINAEAFPGIGIDRAILIELTPAGIEQNSPSNEREIGDTGRVDATVVVRHSESDGLALVIESKLYGRAGTEQLLKYEQALKKRQIKTLLVAVTWEEVYALVDNLPEAAEHDAILSDFKSFLARDPRLAGFTGFRQGDFDGPPYILDARLQKLCETLAGQAQGSALQGAKVERKRGGLDYDILLVDQSRLVGNIGLACWEQKALYAKLVIGWRSRWQTDRVLKSRPAAESVNGVFQRLVDRADVTLDATVRPFFNRFEYPSAAQWSRDVKRQEDPSDVWAGAIKFAHSYHAKPLSREDLEHLQRHPVSVLDQDALNRALKEQVNCFVPLGLVTAWQPEDLARLKSDALPEVVRKTLGDLADLLRLLSGVPIVPPSGVPIVPPSEVDKQIRKRFWTDLLEKAKKNREHLSLYANVEPTGYREGYRKMRFASDIDNLHFIYHTTLPRDGGSAWVELCSENPTPHTIRVYQDLLQHREEIERAFGKTLMWTPEHVGGYWCIWENDFSPDALGDENRWPEVQDKMIDAMIRLKKALMPHIERWQNL